MNRGQTALAALVLWFAVPATATAQDLPPPEVRRSVRRVLGPSRPVAVVPTRPSAVPARAVDRTLPYRPPYVPHRAGSPGARPAAAPTQPPRAVADLPPPTVSRGLPLTTPWTSPAGSRRMADAATPRPRAASAPPRWRAPARRVATRRPAPPRACELTVPPAPGHVPIQSGVRRTLPFVAPPGCAADG